MAGHWRCFIFVAVVTASCTWLPRAGAMPTSDTSGVTEAYASSSLSTEDATNHSSTEDATSSLSTEDVTSTLAQDETSTVVVGDASSTIVDDGASTATEESFTTEVTSTVSTVNSHIEREAKEKLEQEEDTQSFASRKPKIQCGKRLKAKRNGRIVGGKDTYEGEFPWTVSVRLLSTHFCGGAIINKYWILTAAHCVKRYSARYFRVRLGEKDVNVEESRPDLDVYVEEISVHPDFGHPRRYSNDLALLKLKRPLAFDEFALPVCLPVTRQDLVGRNATVVGWGWLNEVDKGKSKAKLLQKVQVPVLNNTICAKWYSDEYQGYVQIHDYQICAGYKEGGKDSCQGDSGGPLVMKEGERFSIIGVVSAGVGCARRHLPGIYSRVSHYVPWIRNVTGGNT